MKHGKTVGVGTNKPQKSAKTKLKRFLYLTFASLIMGSFLQVLLPATPVHAVRQAPDGGGFDRVNALTLQYNGDYYYYDGNPTGAAGSANDTGEVKVKGGTISIKDGPVFQALNLDSSLCYDVIYNPIGMPNSWVREYSTLDNGVCTQPVTTVLQDAPTNNDANSGISFFFDASGNIESVRLTNATPFVRVTASYPGSDQLKAVYMEQKPASDCPNLFAFYKSGSIGFIAPQKGTPNATDKDSAYRDVLRAFTGSDNAQCIVRNDDGHNNLKVLKGTFLAINPSAGGADDIGFLNMSQVAKKLRPGIISDSTTAAGPALDRQDSQKQLDDSKQKSGGSCDQGSSSTTCKTSTTPSCESSGWNLSWIVCPVITGLASAVDGIYDHLISPLLETKPVSTSNSSNEPTNTYKIWSSFRIYGDIFLVIALLVVVFGEALGGGMIDAYTAKKILPRLLVAAILINVSIYVVALLVDVTNILGKGLMALIEAPWASTGQLKIHLGQVTGDGLGIAGILGVSGTIWAAVAAGGALIEVIGALAILFLVPAALTIIAILVTIVIRNGLILFLIFVSPIAFALYCLPNTEKYFKQWWSLLVKTLMVYPIIAVVFAMGNVLSVTINSTASGALGPLSDLLSVIALFIPLFLIPFSFRIAGGAIGKINEAVMSARDKVHQMGEGKRQEAKARLQGIQAQASRAGWQRVHDRTQGVWGLGKITGNRVHRAERRIGTGQAQRLKTEALAHVAHDNDATRAGTYGSYGEAVRGLSEFFQRRDGVSSEEANLKAKEAARRWDSTGLGWSQSSQMAAFQAAVADGTTIEDGRDQAEMITRIARGNKELREHVWGQAYSGNKMAGRFDLSPSYGTGSKLLERAANGETISDEEWDASAVEGLRSTSNTQLSQMKGKGMTNGAQSMARNMMHLRSIIDDPNTSDADRAAAQESLAEIVVKGQNMKNNGLYFPEALTKILNQEALRPEHSGLNPQQIQQEIDTVERQAQPQVTRPVQDAAGNVILDRSGNPIPEVRRGPSGQVIFDATNNPVQTSERIPNPDYNPTVARTVAEQGQRMGLDPRHPGGPLDPNAPPPTGGPTIGPA